MVKYRIKTITETRRNGHTFSTYIPQKKVQVLKVLWLKVSWWKRIGVKSHDIKVAEYCIREDESKYSWKESTEVVKVVVDYVPYIP